MNYKKHYEKLIENYGTKAKPLGVYTELHHIVPKSLGGNNLPENLVWLDPKAHYIAHFLLWKIHRNRSMAFAFHNMTITSYGRKRVYSSKVYSSLRAALANHMSESNPMYSPEIALKISGEKHYMKSKEKQAELSARRKGSNNPMYGIKNNKSKQFRTPFGVFSNLTTAAKALNIDPNTVYRRMKENPSEWFRLP